MFYIEIERIWEDEGMLAFGAHIGADDEGIVLAIGLVVVGVAFRLDWPKKRWS